MTCVGLLVCALVRSIDACIESNFAYQKLNVKPSVVNDYEQGKVIPDNAVLGKMERALGVKLRGKPDGGGGPAKKKK